MRSLALLFLLFSGAAIADLYRWVDPQSGSVKFSSVPPPWYGDAQLEARSPKVEVISAQPKPAAVPAEKAALDKATAQEAAIAAERRKAAAK